MSTRTPESPRLNGDDFGSEKDWNQWSAEIDGLDEVVLENRDALPRLEITENPAPQPSYVGWLERARDVQPGRGYEFTDLSKANRVLGDMATTGFDRRRPISDYGMPRIQTRRRIGRLGLPGINF